MVKEIIEKRFLILLSTLVFLSSRPITQTNAAELDDLNQQLSELQDRITQLEANEKTENAALPENLKWLENVKISGDLRYRHDHTDLELESSGSVKWLNGSDRDRIRARLMFDAIINDDWDVGLRIASGSSRTPNSTNQDLEDAFSSKEIWLDLAYFNWHPAEEERLNVFGGKMKNPFYKVGSNELIWDSDLNPEGLAAQYVWTLSDTDQLFLNGSGFWVDESSLDVDTSLWGTQAYWKHTISNPDYVLAGASYYDYGNLQGRSALSSTWSSASIFFGNTSSGGLYRYDYNILEAFGEYVCEFSGMPTAIFSSWVTNNAAGSSENTGWLIGTKLSKAEDPSSWEFSYDYREVDADAVVGGFIESDYLGSFTNSRGHKFGLKYQLAKNIQTVLTYYHLEDTSSSVGNLDYRRIMADLVFKF
ncbi:putative porin [Planctomycetota bacterium]